MTEFAITPSKMLLDTKSLYKIPGGLSFRTCYTKPNIDFPYAMSLSLRRDIYRRTPITDDASPIEHLPTRLLSPE